MSKFFIVPVSLVVLFAVLIQPAQAYLDPGTGSYILQILAAGVLGSLLMLKTYWFKVKSFFTGSRGDEADDGETERGSSSEPDA